MTVAVNTPRDSRVADIPAVASTVVADAAKVRVAVLSDVHGNLTAFEAVLKDIELAGPDLVLHGGDLCDPGSSPAEIVDAIRRLGWQGVIGNTDETLARPDCLEEFAGHSQAPGALWATIREIASATRSVLGEERVKWLGGLPLVHSEPAFSVVHASPQSCWRAPAADATDKELEAVYGGLGKPIVVFGHTHLPFFRKTAGQPEMVVNMGSVGLPFDGDPRASYLLMDGCDPQIRRIEYDVDKELRALACCGLPGADWTARMLRASSSLLP